MKKILLANIFFCILTSAFSQSFDLNGIVYDEKGETLVGVSVYVKDKPGVGIMTNIEGKFTMKNVSRGNIIVFSFIGYEKEEYLVLEDKEVIIYMKEATQTLDEVVVTGLGAQRKISVVGAVSTIEPQQLQVPATSVANMLGGRMPGVISLQTSGEPGKNISEFWIRGIGTFGASTSALVLIDGLEGNLNSVDPADIESFSILKDASATAVYGVRGANGVVLVTTKRGIEGKLKVNVRTNYTISQLTRMPKYVRSYEYAKLVNEARIVRHDEPLYSPIEMQIFQYGLDRDLYPDVDWQKEIVNPTSFQQTHYINTQGGGAVARYFLSLGMSNESAAYNVDPNSPYKVGTGYNTYSYRSNLDVNLTKTTQLYFGVDGYLTQNKAPGIASTDYIWEAQSQLPPTLLPLVYSTGELPGFERNNSNFSPYVMINHSGTSNNQSNEVQMTLALKQDLSFITKGLNIRFQGAYNTTSWHGERRSVLPDLYYARQRDVDGNLLILKSINKEAVQYSEAQQQYRKYHFESTLNYDRMVGVHRFSGLVYYYMSDSKNTFDTYNSGIEPSMAAIPKRYQGISSRLTYGIKDTYLLDVNFGYTGSENFQAGRRFGFFPSIAIGWVLSNYEFVKSQLPFIDFFKIRGSYGTVGNDKISNKRFPYLTIVDENAPAAWIQNENGIIERAIGADNLKWEKALKANVGIEGKLFNEHLNFVIDVFKDKRDGIFQTRAQIPDYVGLMQMPYGNVGRMHSYGSDGNVEFTKKVGKDISFTIRGNYTYSKNIIDNWEQATPKYSYQSLSGYPYGAIRGYISLGLFRDEQDIKSSPAQKFSPNVMPGDIKYKDINGDGVINTDDQVVLTNPTYPSLMFGCGGDFRYKNLTIGILFKGTGNTDFYHVGYGGNGMGYVPFHGGNVGNVLQIAAEQKNRWTPASYSGNKSTENQAARFPRLSYGYNANNSQLSTFWKGNSRYLRLQEVTINYNIKSDYFNYVGLSSIDLQLVGTNLYVWDNVKLWDPEQAYLNGRAYPIPRRFTFQVFLNF